MGGIEYSARKTKMNFQITPEEHAKVNKWLHETVYPAILEEQRKDPSKAMWHVEDENGYVYPYFGAIGGEVTYRFTPTSIGTAVHVEACGHELDLTDYESW